MMVHHDNNHHRPFRSPSLKFDGDGDVTAGTNARFYSSGGAVNGGLGVVGGATHGSRPLNHPPFESVISTSSSSFSGMGYPFTQAQWRELERQAMIYKHMVASVPVPPDLLFPLPSVPDSHYSCGAVGAGSCSLRFGKDPEPGRCRRTDGKKWRCSRDAALDQKYCERHLNRGRPRSRKHVEVSASITSSKKNRHCHGSNAPLPSTSAALTSATESHHNHQAPPMFVQGAGGFEPATVAHNKEARGLDWLMMGDHRIEEDALGHNSNYSTTEANQLNEYLFPLSNSDVFHLAEQQRSTTRGFIDAWSDSNSKQSCPASQHDQKLSLSEELGPINMCLGVTTNWSQSSDAGLGSWISPAPGGPLGEVFRAAANTVSSPSSPNSGSPQISSPSGVLQRKMASVSDSSGGSSPILGSSMGRSEITVQWFNPN